MGEQMRKAFVATVVLTAVTTTLPVLVGGTAQAAPAATPRSIAYLPNRGTTLQVLDMQSGISLRPIPGFSAPSSVALLPDGTRAYVTNSTGRTVSVVDTATDRVSATIAG